MAAACTTGGGSGSDDSVPTDTLAPLFTLTPRRTATPFYTMTPLPTFTPIPSETPIPPPPSETPTPTPTQPITGIISSLQTVNIREGPGTSFSAFRALNPGTGVEILGQNQEGNWLNILMDDGEEGWVSATLVFLEATATPFPTLTPSPDFTALALGTPLPTALIGGGTVTPTPPRSVVTETPEGTPADEEPPDPNVEPSATIAFLPIIDVAAVNQTATALAASVNPVPISPPAPPAEGQSPNVQATDIDDRSVVLATPTSGGGGNVGTFQTPTLTSGGSASPSAAAQITATTGVQASTPGGNAAVQSGVDVFAMCDNPVFGIAAPTNLAAGSDIEVFWAWYVSDPQYIDPHVEAVTYEIRVNGDLLSNWRQYGQRTIQVGNSYAKYWYVPFGPLQSGNYTITYRATWSEQIFDGYEAFGPGTRNAVEEGSCTFAVR